MREIEIHDYARQLLDAHRGAVSASRNGELGGGDHAGGFVSTGNRWI
jgi:hypothetical protein